MTHALLVHLADLLRKLPPDQIAELYAGTARLEVVPKAGRPTRAIRAAKAPAELGISVEQVNTDLAKIDDRTAATRYVEDLGLLADQLRELAKQLGASVASKATKPVTVAAIVQRTVGRRLDSDAVSRPAPSRF
jgi:hypothetical protein